MSLLKCRYKILRRFNYDFRSLVYGFNTKSLLKKKVKIFNKKLSFSKVFYEKFISKQHLKFNYLLNEKRLKFCIQKAFKLNNVNKIGILLNLYNLLEFSLDYVLFNIGLVKTILEAKQIINHKNVLINGNVCCNPKYICLIGDTIEIKNKIDNLYDNSIDLENNYILGENKIIIKNYHINIPPFVKNLLTKTLEYY